MAHTTTPESQPDERPLQGICLDCGLGYKSRVPDATKCYGCWRASRATQAPVDERSQRRYRHREDKDGTATPALIGDDRTFALPKHDDGSTPAWRANLARALTCRLRATRTTDPEAQRRLRATAYDLERLARSQRYDAERAARAPSRPTPGSVAAISALASDLRGLVVA